MILIERLKKIGPGAMVAAAFIGPGTVTTATLVGATFGYTLLWAVFFSTIATFILQEMSARLGLGAGLGLGEAIRNKVEGVNKWISTILVLVAILLGNAAYEAGNITGAVIGLSSSGMLGEHPIPFIWILGLIAFALLYSGKYKLIEQTLVLLVAIMGVIFLGAALLARPDWSEVFKGLFLPLVPEGSGLLVLGIIGTTVVPYNLFLHASSVQKKWSGPQYIPDARIDTFLSVFLGGLITGAIMISAAVALHGQSDEVEITDFAKQLKPILGSKSEMFLALGFLGAGLSSSITAPLAAAFATSGILGWSTDLNDRKFRLVWMFVLMTGLIVASLGIKPLRLILLAQSANGVLLPIVAAFLLWTMNDQRLMGDFINTRWQNALGVGVLLITLGLGLKSIWTAIY